MGEKSEIDLREEQLQQFKKTVKHLITRIIILFILSAFGGFLFRWAEGSKELEYKCGIKKVRRDFVDTLWQGSRFMNEEDWKTVARRRLLKFEDELHNAYESGMDAESGSKTWNFLNSMFYAMTIMSTIGYGHISVSTVLGKVLSILYALVGIPICTIVIGDATKVFTCWVKLLMTRNPSHRNDYAINDEFNFPLKTTFLLFSCYSLMGTLFFYMTESEWSLLDSFYFIFITNTTVGFGDYIPQSPLVAIMTSIYFLFGLAITAAALGVVQEKLEPLLESLTEKFGILTGYGKHASQYEELPEEDELEEHLKGD